MHSCLSALVVLRWQTTFCCARFNNVLDVLVLADAVESSSITAVSLEDAHRPNDLSLLERFRETTVILGLVAVARSRLESVEEIRARIRAALGHIDGDERCR